MQEYDTALKLLLQSSANSIIRQVLGLQITRWLNVELPRTQTGRVDLLGVTVEGDLIHIELQSSNDGKMALRMAEYALTIYRQFGKLPKQIVLYVGQLKLRMNTALIGPDPTQPDFIFRYTLLDIRDLDSDILLASPQIADNVLAILTRLKDQKATVRQILQRITTLDKGERRALL